MPTADDNPTSREHPWWTDEPIDGWQVSWSNRDLAELAPNIYGPTELWVGVSNWRGLDLALDVVATPDGYRCPSVTLSRPAGVIDYAAFRLTPIEEVLKATAHALVMVAPDGAAFWWPMDGMLLDGLRELAVADKKARDALAVGIYALASLAGLPPRETVVRALEVPTATVSRIIARARSAGTYPDPFTHPRPLAHVTTDVVTALGDHYGARTERPSVAETFTVRGA